MDIVQETPVVNIPPSGPSIADLKARMYPAPDSGAKKLAEKELEPKPETAETGPAKPEPEGKTEAASAPAKEAQPEPVDKKEEPDEPLPPNVQKRIAKEVKRQGEIDQAIREAKSQTKAKEDELRKLTGKSGSEPAPIPEPEENLEPVEPDYEEPSISKYETLEAWETAKSEARAKYKTARAEWKSKYAAWLKAETAATVTDELTERQLQSANQQDLARAIKERGGEQFLERRKVVAEHSTEPFQMALTALGPGRWDALVDYLGVHVEELKALEASFADNAAAAMAELGALEYRLKQEAKKPESAEKPPPKAEKPLPEPPKKVGGGASAGGAVFNFAKEPMSREWKDRMSKLVGR